MSVIYKLIWYQDGYEQPSEEDLKRIMNVSSLSLSLVLRDSNLTGLSYISNSKTLSRTRMTIQQIYILGILLKSQF